MGSVSNYFTDLEDKAQVVEWRNLVYLIAKRYIGESFTHETILYLTLTKVHQETEVQKKKKLSDTWI